MTLVKLAVGVVNAKIITDDRAVKLKVSELLSYMAKGAEHTTAFKQTGWNGRSSFFSFKDSRFPAGFWQRVYKGLTAAGYKVQLVRHQALEPRGVEEPIVDAFGEDPRYDYQRETVRRLIKHRQMIARIATGGGKSRIAKIATMRIKRPTLFLTTRSILMHQMKRAYEEMGLKVGVVGDGEWTPCRGVNGVNVGMVQTLVARLKELDAEQAMADIAKSEKKLAVSARRKGKRYKTLSWEELIEAANARVRAQNRVRQQTIRFLETMEFVIGEEAHEAGGNSYFEILRHCKNAHYRLALTATPFMRDDEESNMRLMAAFGPIGIEVSEKLLIDRGILARPIFKKISSRAPDKVKKWSTYQRAVNMGIDDNPYRNNDALFEVVRAVKHGLTVMVLIKHKAHGEIVRQMCVTAGLRAKFIFGEHSQEVRHRALQDLKNGEIDVLIGSTILDVGVDVPAVGMVVLLGGGRAEVGHRQRIGRGLREKKSGPNVCFIVDFEDGFNSHLASHAAERWGYVEDTPGFAENILKPGEDFPYHLFTSKAA